MNKKPLEKLFEVAVQLADRKDIIQGGGGNLSVKINENEMIIKASGFSFSELKEKNGVVSVDYAKIRKFFDETHNGNLEDEYDAHVKNCIIGNTDKKPSIEAGMHVFLGKSILHTHPVMSNVLTCMKDGKLIAEELFSDLTLLWIDYVNPGYSLAKTVKERAVEYTKTNGIVPEVIFLKNHGLIVICENLGECLDKTLDINDRIERYLKKIMGREFIAFPKLKLVLEKGIYVSRNNAVRLFLKKHGTGKLGFLAPDDVVFLEEVSFSNEAIYSADEKKSLKLDEVLTARIWIQLIIEKIGTPEYLKATDVEYIRNMNSEKYRKKI